MNAGPMNPGAAANQYIDVWFLRHLEADAMMTAEERRLSEARSQRHDVAFQEFKARMKEENGLDGGPSPAVVFNEPFIFEGVTEIPAELVK